MRYCVYVVGPITGFPCKVGVAGNLKKRVDTLQTGHWEELSIHHAVMVRSKSLAFKVEKLAMNRLKDHRIRGEWFNVFAKDAAKVLNDLIDEMDGILKIKGNLKSRLTPQTC